MRFKIFSRPVDLWTEPAIEPFPGHLPEDVPLRVDEGERRPAPDAEGLPEQAVAVDSNRVPDTGTGDRLPGVPGAWTPMTTISGCSSMRRWRSGISRMQFEQANVPK